MSQWEILLVLSIFTLIAIVGGFLKDYFIENSFYKTIEKRKRKFGEDYQEESIRRFKERYPDN